MRKILFSSLGLLGLAVVALPVAGAEAHSAAPGVAVAANGPAAVQTAPAAIEHGVAATDDSAANRRTRRRPRRGGTTHR